MLNEGKLEGNPALMAAMFALQQHNTARLYTSGSLHDEMGMSTCVVVNY